MLLAGLTDVFVTGILTKWINVKPNPIAIPAKPFGALSSVAPSMINRNIPVITVSVTKADSILYFPGECSPYPLAAKLPMEESLPVTIRYKKLAAAIAPATCDIMYGAISFALILPPAHKPIVTAGLRCAPEMCPNE